MNPVNYTALTTGIGAGSSQSLILRHHSLIHVAPIHVAPIHVAPIHSSIRTKIAHAPTSRSGPRVMPAVQLLQPRAGHVSIDLGGGEIGMAEQQLHHP